jgi:S-DNA-T family DNA segregation ATPase FtsK/SpoIIIE
MSEDEVYDLMEEIEKGFSRYKLKISIDRWKIQADRAIFPIKLKGSTRESQVYARASDVQLRLKLPLFQLFKQNLTIYLAVSEREIVYDHLPQILINKGFIEQRKKMALPYILGFDSKGDLVVSDLARFPHLLIGGSTNSGKTVSTKALVASLISCKSPNKVNFVVIDVGATDLTPFNDVPHLSCPVIRDGETALKALLALKAEMERRIELEISDPEAYRQLSRIVIIIDEAPALLSGVHGKEIQKLLIEAISSILQRGRHAKLHVVISAQNPTIQNMKIDLGNVTSRVAFKCAKRNFSETILGEGGAEHLVGKGDLLLKSPQHNDLHRIQGVYITNAELGVVIEKVKFQRLGTNYPFKFTINDTDLCEELYSFNGTRNRPITAKSDADDRLLVEIITWALERDSISCNNLCDTFKIGWRRANVFIDKLNTLGIVGEMFAKLPRPVLPHDIDDIDINLINFLAEHGVSEDQITTIINARFSKEVRL